VLETKLELLLQLQVHAWLLVRADGMQRCSSSRPESQAMQPFWAMAFSFYKHKTAGVW
jgi:hypothetical protein